MFSIIIPTYNKLRQTDVAIRNLIYLIDEKYKGNYEIIVAIDGSQDGSNEYFLEFNRINSRIKVVFTNKAEAKRANPGLARNAGLKAAIGDVIAFMDCEVIHMLDPITPTLEILKEKGETTIVKGVQNRILQNGEFIESSPDNPVMPHGGWLSGYKKQFMKIGGYDERFQIYGREDNDIATRLQKDGNSFVSAKNIMYYVLFETDSGRDSSEHAKYETIDRVQLEYCRDALFNPETMARNIGKEWGVYHKLPVVKPLPKNPEYCTSVQADRLEKLLNIAIDKLVPSRDRKV
ncbi:MAG: glycosyltransferase family 2 protein [Gammaproteobacteria bacterium]|nr:glycosyltransferase family 2 protein [Gammaproteobacteria bacterium]